LVVLRLKQTGARGQKDAADNLLEALLLAGGSLPLGDKSSPDEIYQRLGMSKKAFKAAVGVLYKLGKVVPGPLTVRKVDPASDPIKS
jgi:predicted RNA-binding protein (virulence factor B family)